MADILSDEQKKGVTNELLRVLDDFPYYSQKYLKIATKAGGQVPFQMNRAQLYVHDRLETQLYEEGQVRAIILKGRQQGISTYVSGRFFWKSQMRRGIKTYILTHLAEATDTLFEMVERYITHLDEWLKPETDTHNAKQLRFPTLDSGYKVNTAGSKGAGRSGNYHLFHGSEVALWPNAEKHAAGALQTVGGGNNTEIIFESTAYGPGGYFHTTWVQATKGLGDFIAIFIPWYWQDEYTKEPRDEDWQPEGDEAERMRVYKLTRAQTFWMYSKNIEMGGMPGVLCPSFLQEYPCTAAEAFVSSGGDTICKPELVAAARQREITDPFGARVMGVDPARMGNDRSSMIDRKGRRAYNLESFRKKKTTEVASLVARRIDRAIAEQDPYAAVFVDVGGVGGGVVDILHDTGYDHLVIPVDFGGKPIDPVRYTNKRAEIWSTMGEWFEMEGGVDIPNDDSLHADLIGPTYTHNLIRNQLVLESKEQMVKRGIPSPDEGDGLALTFSFPVAAPTKKSKRRAAPDWRT